MLRDAGRGMRGAWSEVRGAFCGMRGTRRGLLDSGLLAHSAKAMVLGVIEMAWNTEDGYQVSARLLAADAASFI